jgi:hypothetical protein
MTDVTRQKVEAQLKHNTGRHMLDSGGAYGRHWERNQAIESLYDLPSIRLEWNTYTDRTTGAEIPEPYAVINTAHYLASRLDWDDVSVEFEKYREADDTDDSWWDVMERFILEYLGDRAEPKFDNDGDFYHDSGYTYNCENILSQDFQWSFITIDGWEYVFIMTHNGCDARGGFSYPELYVMPDSCYFYDWNRYELYAEAPEPDPNQLTLIDLPRLDPWCQDMGDCWGGEPMSGPPVDIGTCIVSEDPDDRGTDKMFIDPDTNIAYLPIYGTPIEAYWHEDF